MSKIKEQNSSERLESAENTEDQEFDKWVRHQFLEEAKDIEKEIGQIPDSKAWEPTEEKFQELLQKAKKQGTIQDPADFIQKRDSEKDRDQKNKNKNRKEKLNKEKRDDTKEKVVKKHSQKPKAFNFREKVIKWAAVAAVTVFGIFGVSMSSEANRAYIMERVDSMMGNDVGTTMDNNDTLQGEITEEKAKADIEEALLIKLPDFFYFPEDMNFKGYEVDEEAKIGVVQYLSGENVVTLIAFPSDKRAAAFALSDSGDMLGDIDSKIFNAVHSTLWKVQENGDEMPTYVLQWDYKNVYYELTGKISEAEMRKIAENIMY